MIVGTENRQVLILDPSGSVVKVQITLPSVPVFLCTSGLFDVEYRLTIACRNGSIYTIRNGEISGIVVDLGSLPCALCKFEKHIAAATMQNTIVFYNGKGKKQHTIYLPCPIKAMENLEMKASRNLKLLVVALANQELRVYNGKTLISTVKTIDVVVGMKFGTYGTEPNTLILTYRNGGIEFKYLARKAKLEGKTDGGPPPEQEQALELPKKTKLYLEQIEREKQISSDMYRIFQRDLCKMRVKTAKSFLKMLTDGQSAISYQAGSAIRLNAQVQGLGPVFKIRMIIQNTGTKTLCNVPILFAYNQEIYTMKNSQMNVYYNVVMLMIYRFPPWCHPCNTNLLCMLKPKMRPWAVIRFTFLFATLVAHCHSLQPLLTCPYLKLPCPSCNNSNKNFAFNNVNCKVAQKAKAHHLYVFKCLFDHVVFTIVGKKNLTYFACLKYHPTQVKE